MVRFRFGGDVYYRLGVDALMQAVSPQGQTVNRLHFPDMRYLLAWSRNPVLSPGLTLVTGNARVIATLRGIVSPASVELSGSDDALASLKHRLQLRFALPAPESPPVKEVRLTESEMSYMWGLMHGNTSLYSIKKDSLLRRSVMQKIGADSLVSLMVRFRLLFALPPEQLCLQVRMSGKAPRAGQPLPVDPREYRDLISLDCWLTMNV